LTDVSNSLEPYDNLQHNNFNYDFNSTFLDTSSSLPLDWSELSVTPDLGSWETNLLGLDHIAEIPTVDNFLYTNLTTPLYVPHTSPVSTSSNTHLNLPPKTTTNLATAPPTTTPPMPITTPYTSTPTDATSKSSSPQSPKSSTSDHHPGVRKRSLNTLAARRYRQRRVDQVAMLEAALKESEAEKDALKARVARLEGEVDVLRSLISK